MNHDRLIAFLTTYTVPGSRRFKAPSSRVIISRYAFLFGKLARSIEGALDARPGFLPVE
jgi:hypothetical protein